MVTLKTEKAKPNKNINKQRQLIIISMGIEDDYEHLDESIDYILENILMEEDDDSNSSNNQEFQQLNDLYNSRLIQSCACLIVDGEPNCNNINNCLHGGNYKYQQNSKELILNTCANDEHRRRPIIECDDLCKCQSVCMNRLVQFGPRKHLEIFESPVYKSLGLRTNKSIPKGAFICEYAGELLTRQEALRRSQLNDEKNKMNYVLFLNEYKSDNSCQIDANTTIVDPSRRGNIGRYINHSCDPNCETHAVRVTCPIPKIGIFAKHNIKALEELSFHYGNDNFLSTSSTSLRKPCLCGALKCSKYLPNIKI